MMLKMKLIKITSSVAFGAFSLSAFCQASFSYEDCLLQGLKGVSSDAAARIIQEACNNKKTILTRETDKKINEEWGDETSTSILEEVAKTYSAESEGNASIEFKNISTENGKIISYIELSVRGVDASGFCSFALEKVYSYKSTLKQNSTIKLIFPRATDTICSDVTAVRTKASKWSDFSLSSSVRPTDGVPFAKKPVASRLAPAPSPAPAASPLPYIPPKKK